ncbi:MAG: UDP-4-keto-6-deoxyglucose-3, 5-epimerase/-4-reductase [Parcubacteria group bacterium GW2011_GWC1_43_11]|uniref:dTDP-4-dehydrorhamnose reductase n=1 Tax=Candidatus Woesebacteria bacterium GW2011_GWA1_41_13b TaxID=1618555 RepID=A0A0G0UX87_9BACT|nr:MAG: UDP-4-keto-6-deoxyglucose-3, 5-epimerase/-4-reductase [Candidatus Woesebacteria bacterium GW2011_GWA1_41_13b]KKS87914.1 MAG: UDP-4-keto-6-deoxyglucose-3, 5-epimerase/-4-reductase [Parcubacteria group bacterium GW2011_GWC1_43_11]
MSEKILIFGNGQMANFALRYFTSKNISVFISPADITDISQIEKAISDYQPTVVINTAAKTNLEWCVQNKLQTFNVNVLGANNIAQACDEKHIYFVHFSSGCILASKDENDAKVETDIPAPISYYSWTKVWAENLIPFRKSQDFKCLILRPRQPVSAQVDYKNMLVKMLTFTQFIEVPNNGTVIEDLMIWMDKLINKRVTGIVHVANGGWVTPYDIGLLLKKYVLPELPVNKMTKDELNTHTPERRVDTILNNDKLISLVGEVKPYKQRLEEIIIQLAKNFKEADPELIKVQLEKTLAQTKTRAIPNDVWPNLMKK